MLAGARALRERDLKKIVALSTLSQVGLLFAVVGVSSKLSRFFHLLRHAFFKAALFIVVGNIIAMCGGYQDVRLVGLWVKQAPLSGAIFCSSTLRLIGVPFLSGFFSKDFFVIERMASSPAIVVLAGCLFSSAYVVRLAAAIFSPRFSGPSVLVRDNDIKIFLSAAPLCVFSAVFG